MIARTWLWCLLLPLFGLGSAWAQANPSVIREIRAKNVQAMASYDLLEYEDAQRLLREALALAKKQGVKDPVVAQAFLNLAIVLHSGFSNVADARLAMIEAVRIDDTIEFEPAYRTKTLSAMLVEAKREFGQAKPSDCGAVKGIQHVRIERAPARADRLVEAQIGDELDAKEAYVYYRPAESSEFVRLSLEPTKGCTYAASIPGEAMTGDSIHYYLQAVNRRGVVVANRGSREDAYIVELDQAGSSSTEVENPFGVARTAAGPAEDRPRFFLLLAGGSGGGIVTGTTEQTRTDVSCCFGAALLHVTPEVGFSPRKNLTISAVLRWGFPLGANLPGHSVKAVSSLARVRYGFGENLNGLQVIGSIGGGFIRHTVKLTETQPGMGDTDTTASGPFIVGPGVAYWFPIGSGTLKLLMESHALIAFSAGLDQFAGNQTGFGVQFDFNLGAALAF